MYAYYKNKPTATKGKISFTKSTKNRTDINKSKTIQLTYTYFTRGKEFQRELYTQFAHEKLGQI